MVGLSKQWPPHTFTLVLWYSKAFMHELENVLSASSIMRTFEADQQKDKLGTALRQTAPDMVFVYILNGVQSAVEVHKKRVYTCCDRLTVW